MEANPLEAVLREVGGFKLFVGVVEAVSRETVGGFTWTEVKLHGSREFKGSTFKFKAKNEVLVAYRDGRLAAIAPDIITPVHPETARCVPAERIREGGELAVLGIPAPSRWRSRGGLELWGDVLQRSGVHEPYTPIERLVSGAS